MKEIDLEKLQKAFKTVSLIEKSEELLLDKITSQDVKMISILIDGGIDLNRIPNILHKVIGSIIYSDIPNLNLLSLILPQLNHTTINYEYYESDYSDKVKINCLTKVVNHVIYWAKHPPKYLSPSHINVTKEMIRMLKEVGIVYDKDIMIGHIKEQFRKWEIEVSWLLDVI